MAIQTLLLLSFEYICKEIYLDVKKIVAIKLWKIECLNCYQLIILSAAYADQIVGF